MWHRENEKNFLFIFEGNIYMRFLKTVIIKSSLRTPKILTKVKGFSREPLLNVTISRYIVRVVSSMMYDVNTRIGFMVALNRY